MSEDVTELQKKILASIIRENQRPSAIAKKLRRVDKSVDQNKVVVALLDLEKRGLAERSTSKAWIARGSASDFIDE